MNRQRGPAPALAAVWLCLFALSCDSDTDRPFIAPIDDLEVAELTPNRVRLAFTLPEGASDDRLELRCSDEAPINDFTWDAAAPLGGGELVRAAGSRRRFLKVAAPFPDSNRYYFALRHESAPAGGGTGRVWSSVSNPASGSWDRTGPARINDLSARPRPDGTVRLRWRATGDDGREGAASVYVVYRATHHPARELLQDWLLKADTEILAPLPAGTWMERDLTGLEPGRRYYIGVRAADERPNWSPLSNLVVVNLPGVPAPPAPGRGSGLPKGTEAMKATASPKPAGRPAQASDPQAAGTAPRPGAGRPAAEASCLSSSPHRSPAAEGIVLPLLLLLLTMVRRTEEAIGRAGGGPPGIRRPR